MTERASEVDYWKDETLRARLDAQDSVDYWRQEAKRARAEIDCECTHVYGRVEYDAAFQNIAAERDALRAEVERLRATCAKWNGRDLEQSQEIDRLRAALQEILDHPAPSHVFEVAREALDGHTPRDEDQPSD